MKLKNHIFLFIILILISACHECPKQISNAYKFSAPNKQEIEIRSELLKIHKIDFNYRFNIDYKKILIELYFREVEIFREIELMKPVEIEVYQLRDDNIHFEKHRYREKSINLTLPIHEDDEKIDFIIFHSGSVLRHIRVFPDRLKNQFEVIN